MSVARVVTAWVGDGASDATAYRPRLRGDYPAVTFMDATGQPATDLVPSPNLFTVEVTCDPATLAAIAADPNYLVLWSE